MGNRYTFKAPDRPLSVAANMQETYSAEEMIAIHRRKQHQPRITGKQREILRQSIRTALLTTGMKTKGKCFVLTNTNGYKGPLG